MSAPLRCSDPTGRHHSPVWAVKDIRSVPVASCPGPLSGRSILQGLPRGERMPTYSRSLGVGPDAAASLVASCRPSERQRASSVSRDSHS
jgi:hypothetical protein